MTEALGTQLHTSPLDVAHRRLGAEMLESDGWNLPASYGDTKQEYAAVRDGGAGLIDLSSRGRIRVGGSEAVQFLNGLITNDMKTLAAGSWMPAVFPNVQGRIIAAVRVIRLRDDESGKNACPTFLLDTEPATHERVLKTIERFTLAGDFRVSEVTNSTAQLTVQGKKAADIVAAVFGEELTIEDSHAATQIDWQGGEITVIRSSHTGEDGFDVIVNSEQAIKLWDSLSEAGAQPVGHHTLETLRIEAGVARFGIDMDETTVVSEANLDDAVSFTKGCYLGQEIIVRIKHRGHVAKKLTGVILEHEREVAPGVQIKSLDDKDIGRITSVTYSPRLQRTIALGYVKFDYLAAGTDVKIVVGEAEIPAKVAELPLVGNSVS